jgi:hypothetical protein
MINKHIRLLILLLLPILSSCITGNGDREDGVNEKLLEERGFNDTMIKRLKPEIITIKESVYTILGINKKNSFVAVSPGGIFELATLDENGNVNIETIVSNYPPHSGTSYWSDNEHNMVWQIRGRGIYFLDIESKKTGYCLPSGDGNDTVDQIILVDPGKKLFLIEVLKPYAGADPSMYYVIFDFMSNKPVFKSPLIKADFFNLGNGRFLYLEEKGLPAVQTWYITDLYMKEKIENKLTKELTKLKIDVWHLTKCLQPDKRIMLGRVYANKNYIFFSIRWDSEFENVDIEPIVLQKPGGRDIDYQFEFSADGNWVKSLDIENEQLPPELIIYNVNSIYPQWLSMPIMCGYTREANTGAFLNHDKLGPLYIMLDADQHKKLFVFRLNDGLKILAEQARDAVTGGK